MADKLLLRRGTLQNLSALAIQPGAISITTDVPGLYYDVSDSKRIRIGDFIPVQNLTALANKATNDGLLDTALYYAQDENVLARYDSTQKKLVWINDTAALEGQLKTLIENVHNRITNAFGTVQYDSNKTIAGEFKRIDDKIGAVNDDKDIATVYGAIAKEKARAKDVEANLQDQIDAVLGGESGSIADLQDQIDDLVNQDTILEDNIENNILLIKRVYGNNSTIPESGNHTVHENASNITKIYGATSIPSTGHKTITGNASDITKIYGATSIPSTGHKTITGNASDILNIYGDTSIPTQANDRHTITKNASAIGNINTQITNITTSGGTIDQKVNALKGNESTDDIDSITVYGNNNAIVDLKGSETAYNNATVTGNAKDIATLKGTETAYNNATVTGNAKNIANLDSKIDTIIGSGTNQYTTIAAGVAAAINTANSYTDEQVLELEEAINSTIADANAMTFKGVVALPSTDTSGTLVGKQWWTTTTPVQAGHTYVVSQELNYTNALKCHIGDLLVAANDQSGDTYPKGIVAAGSSLGTNDGWYLIKTGYDASLEDSLSVSSNTVTLLSHVNSNLGSVTFEAPKVVNTNDATKTGSNIEIVTNGSNIQFNLVWVDF